MRSATLILKTKPLRSIRAYKTHENLVSEFTDDIKQNSCAYTYTKLLL